MDFPNFLGGSYQSQSPLVDQERTVNLYFEVIEAKGANTRGALYPTPGVESVVTQTYIGPPLVVAAPVITNGGTPGGETYGYKVVALDPSGHTLPSAEGTTATGNAVLSGTDYNIITWTAIPGATSYQVYRTTGHPGLSDPPPCLCAASTGTSANDTGGGQTTEPPTTNTTGIGNVPGGPGKGNFFDTNSGRQFCVIGSMFYECTSAGVLIPINAVATDANPATICGNGAGGNQLFITSGGNGYLYDTSSDTFSTISALAAKATMGDQLDGYFLALDAATGTVYFSNLLDGTTWDTGTDFFQRSSAADPWISMRVTSSSLIYLLGAETSEAWYNAGTSPVPFIRHSAGLIQWGIAAPFSTEIANGVLYWLGRTSNGQGQVLGASGIRPEVVSNQALENTLAGYSDLSDGIGDTYSDSGHVFYILTLPTAQATWVFDPSVPRPMAWHERGKWNGVVFTAWRPMYHAFAFGQHRILDLGSGQVYQMSASLGFDVDGDAIRRVRRSPAIMKENLRLFYPAFELGLEPGLGLQSGQGSNPLVMLTVSKDGGKVFGIERSRSAGAVGQYGKRVRWLRLGAARKLVIEIAMTDPIPWRLMGAWLPGFADANRMAA